MGTIQPGDWKQVAVHSKSIDPESARRLASGFWKHERAFDTDIDTWVCDKHKLHEAVQKIMMDQWASKQFYRDPTRFLDARFGEGTGEAYRHASQDRVAMRFNPYMGIDYGKERDTTAVMALYNTYTTAGTSGTVTSPTTASGTAWMQEQYIKESMYKNLKSMNQRQFKVPAKPPSVHHNKKLVRNLPFVCGVGDLLNTLQRDFDYWTAPQKRILFA